MIKDPNGVIAYIDVYTWQGMSIGAIHYYAKLTCGSENVELKGKLTQRHATYLNKENRQRGYDWDMYKPGDVYGGFVERQEAIDLAIKTFKHHFKQARCLLLGKRAFIEPKPVLAMDAPDDTINALNLIATASEGLSCEEQDPLNDEWEQLLAQALGLEWTSWL